MFNATIAYIYSDLPSYVRANKTLPILREQFREVHFIGCTRKRALDPGRPEGIHYHIADLQIGNGIHTINKVAEFYKYIKNTLAEIQPDVVMAVNEEYILPFSFRYIPMPKRLVLDLYDSIGMRIFGRGRVLNPVMRQLSQVALRTIHGLSEVSEERLEWHRTLPRENVIIYNSPPFLENVEAKEGLPDKFIYANGMLVDGFHGIETLLEAVEQFDDLHIVFSGRTKGEFLEKTFLTHPKVINLGSVPFEDVFRIITASSGVWAHYNPIALNYVYGAPNKLYEAMMLAKPLFINSENHASAMPHEVGFGLVSPFEDVGSLIPLLEIVAKGDAGLYQGCQHAREVFKEKYAWEHMATRYADFFRRMGVPEVK
ncbi:hypothetical protein K8I28_11290 [bacterium]|nr:hypothetical protein [bacterium]